MGFHPVVVSRRNGELLTVDTGLAKYDFLSLSGLFPQQGAQTIWRTSNGHEVDFILGEMACAIEVKSSSRIQSKDLRGLLALSEEHTPRHKLIVCLEKEKRTLEAGIEVLPWVLFLDKLWGRELINLRFHLSLY